MKTALNAKGCDGHSVAVIIFDPTKGVLIGEVPGGSGATSVGGHVFDDFLSYLKAAYEEVLEEMGLRVTRLKPLFETPLWRGNPCKRGDGPFGRGHWWMLYIAEVEGDRDVDPKSFRNVRWVTTVELQRLADRTLAYVQGEVSRNDWEKSPGIALTWVQWFVDARLISMSAADLQEIETAMEAGVARP